MENGSPAVVEVLRAANFAAGKHSCQRRKDAACSPYINHPLEVAELIARVGRVDDVAVLQAAVLHDTVEDTDATPVEIEGQFGLAVRRMVEEVTDDKRLPKVERKRLQIEHAPRLSAGAKLIKLADKISNVRDVVTDPPNGWSLGRRAGYLDWSEQVVAGCRGVNAELEIEFDRVLRDGRQALTELGRAADGPDG